MKYSCILIALSLLVSCNTTTKNNSGGMDKIKNIDTAKFDKQGHRGCRGLMPENTIPAMLKALDLGVTTLEMDISISKDKKVFLSHEPFFNHEITTKPGGGLISDKEERNFNMYKMNYAEIAKFDVGLKPHPRFPQQQKIAVHKPLLTEVIDTVKEYMKMAKRPFPFFNIETKTQPFTDNIYHPAPDEFVELLMAVIKEKQLEDFVIIQSFDFRTLQYLHQHYPSIKTAILIEDYDKRTLEDQFKALGFSPTIYSPAYSLATKETINKCHAKNIKIIPWTVNDKIKIKELQAAGVDGIITDYPNLYNE